MQTMLQAVRDRRKSEEGFTLIELMVVVLIIAILIAIAIPTFLGAQNRAKDRAAQSSLRNALTSAKTLYTDTSSYLTATPAALEDVEPSLTFQAPASAGPKVVSVLNTSADVITFAARSASGNCYFLRDTATGPGTEFAAGSGATCDAAAPGTLSQAWNPNGFNG